MSEQINTELRWLDKEGRANWVNHPYVAVDSVYGSYDGHSWQRPMPKSALIKVLKQRFGKATYSDELNLAIEKLADDMLAPFGVLGFWEHGKP